MTSFACFLSWVLQLPPVIRLVITSGRLLDAVIAALIDPETGAVRALDAWALAKVERALQIAEVSVSRAIWLRARLIAGLPHSASATRFSDFAPRHLSSPDAMAMRAAHLLDRLAQLERHARALACSMSLGDEFARAAHPQRPFGAACIRLDARSGAPVITLPPTRMRGPVRSRGPPCASSSFPIAA